MSKAALQARCIQGVCVVLIDAAGRLQRTGTKGREGVGQDGQENHLQMFGSVTDRYDEKGTRCAGREVM